MVHTGTIAKKRKAGQVELLGAYLFPDKNRKNVIFGEFSQKAGVKKPLDKIRKTCKILIIMLEIILAIVALAIAVFLVIFFIKFIILIIKGIISALMNRKVIIISSISLLCLVILGVIYTIFSYVNMNEREKIIHRVQTKIIDNMRSGTDLDEGIYKLVERITPIEITPVTGNIVSIQDSIYLDSDIFALSAFYSRIKDEWDEIRKDKTSRIMSKYLDSLYKNNERDNFEYAILSLLDEFDYQIEISESLFPYLLEQFSLKNLNKDELTNVSEHFIDISPLRTNIINIDGIAYDANMVAFIQQKMDRAAKEYKKQLNKRLIDIINSQYNIYIENVDNYLDWYYGGFNNLVTQPVIIIIAFLNPKKTVNEALHEHKIENYAAIIGEGANFSDVIDIIENYRNIMLEQGLIYATALDICNLDSYNNPVMVITQDITGDEFMSAFSAFPEYIGKIISEGLPLMGMGERLDSDFSLVETAINLASLGINFIPGVGFIAGTVVDYVSLKTTEKVMRPEFKKQIISSIQKDKDNLLRVIRID